SPRMIALAKERTDLRLGTEFRVADIMDDAWRLAAYDVVLSVNVVHHMRLEDVVPRLASLVAPGGCLLIQDVATRMSLPYVPLNRGGGVPRPAQGGLGPNRFPPELRRLSEEHGRGESYLRPADVKRAYDPLLPGARIFHHLEWRYSVVWQRDNA